MATLVTSSTVMPEGLRRALRVARLAVVGVLVAACVTINVYFPAAAAEKAADQIIDAVTGGVTRGGGAPAPAAPAPAVPTTGIAAPGARSVLVATLGRALHALVPAAQAQEASLDISSPQIRALTESMNARFS